MRFIAMLADRAGIPLAAGAAVIFALAAPAAFHPHPRPHAHAVVVLPDPQPQPPPPTVYMDPQPDPGPIVELMRGPYPTVAGNCSPCAIDVMTVEGTPPIDEYTVISTSHGHDALAIRTGKAWWLRDLGPSNAVKLDIDAPREHGPQVSVHVTATMSDGDESWTFEQTVTCTVQPTGTPTCHAD